MIRWRDKTELLILMMLILSYSAFTFRLSARFPPVNSDEVVRAVMGQNLLQGKPSRYSLFDDIFARPVYAMRDALPDVSLTVYNSWVGAWMRLFSAGYRSARLSSTVAGGLALLMFYVLGSRVGGLRCGAWCVALGGLNPVFITASCLARPEMLMLFTSVSLLWLALAVPERIGLKPFVLGMLALLQVSVHPNACVIALGIMIFYLVNVPSKDKWQRGLLFAAGGLAGLIIALAIVDMRRVWISLHTVNAYLSRPPLLSWPWYPLTWTWAYLHAFLTGQTFYFNGGLAPGWPASLDFWWLALVLPIVYGSLLARRLRINQFFHWLMAVGVVFFGCICLIRSTEFLYAANVLPFLVPAGASVLSLPSRDRWLHPLRILVCALLGVGVFLFVRFSRAYAAQCKSYPQIVAELRSIIPGTQLKVAGPNTLWFAWDSDHFRDLGAVLFSHWYLGGQRDWRTWLGDWQPDVLILDQSIQGVLRRGTPIAQSLSSELGCPIEFLGVVDTRVAYGQWEVYRIRWAQSTK